MKKLIVLCVGMAALVALNLFCLAQEPKTLDQLSFKNIKILGKVVDEQGNPVPNIKLEMELAPEVELKRDLNLPEIEIDDVIERLKVSVGDGIFTTVTSNEKGEYKISGVPIPGVYYVFVRNIENYLPTRIKLFLNASEQDEYKPQDLVLRARKAGSAGLAISEKAMKEVEKSRKAMVEKNTKKAIKHILKALEIEPKYAEGHYNLAVMYMSAKKRDDAIKHLEKAAEIQKDYKPALKTLGELYLFKKDYEKAAHYFVLYLDVRQKEGNLTLEDAKIYFQTGNCFQAINQRDKAVPFFQNYLGIKQKVGTLDQKDSLLCSDLGSYYYMKKDHKSAIIFYSAAIKVNPEIAAETYMYLGNSYVYNRDGVNGIKYYQKYLELDPNGKFVPQVKNVLEKLKKMYPHKDEEKQKQEKK
ncbi:MAG: tetratricopeptide repeat protein [Candidatus Aminicenantes bacterium]|nr:tetratricopeptide repeat protein [Candidatus Aminicenantes bacterium]NIM83037.1 tetratricopeptide repeat protein [Candidatus Aminicenantes bacterium]NIN22425.1 tetratricopeptide repeat protein [Candidatus Aminicenantes bacterium]NIN46193.1 tetratricopeptide repeat protein [Candidatus Aminicenantes bacterium]NIN89030.1 tetratricopeptide repeat protein [Candidatus Aminicenantes bacterium]